MTESLSRSLVVHEITLSPPSLVLIGAASHTTASSTVRSCKPSWNQMQPICEPNSTNVNEMRPSDQAGLNSIGVHWVGSEAVPSSHPHGG